jgi:transposase InsO family protein
MPWKETNAVSERTDFVVRARAGEETMVALCQEFKISPKTGYKWLKRYEQEGRNGLEDESRAPHRMPQQIGEEQICAIIRLKYKREAWGPKKIQELLKRSQGKAPSLSSVKRILKKAGMVKARRRRRSSQECGRIANRKVAEAPNEVWTIDFKGQWYSAERKRVQPLTVQDAYSRYLFYAQALPDGRMETVRKVMEVLFEQYGLPQTIRSDNGPPFASAQSPLGLSQLSAWWVSLGINLDRIRPGHPEENGGHERMHRDMALEVEQEVDGNWEEQQAALELWRKERNEVRPHEALGMKVPAEMYVKSERKWNKEENELNYPLDCLKRQVTSSGAISVSGVKIRITEALRKRQVGLKKIGSKSYGLWYGPLMLGTVNMETEAFEPQK